MAYVAPSIRSNGDIITATIWNQDVVANPIALKALCDQPSLARLTAAVTVANTVTETTLISATITANTITAGQGYHVVVHGNYQSTGTPNLTIRLKYNGTTLQTTAFATESGAPATTAFRQDYDITFRTSGGTAACMAVQGWRQYGTAVTIGLKQETFATVSTNTTTTGALEVTAQWGTASPSNSLSAHFGKILPV